MIQKKKILIIGGGFAGIAAAKRFLVSSFARKKFDITLVDKNNYHTFYPSFFKIIAAKNIDPSRIFSVAAIKFEDIFKKDKIEILKNEVKDISFKTNQAVLKVNGLIKRVNYDYLIVAPGKEIKNHFLSLGSFEDVLKIKFLLENVFKNRTKKEKINIVVGGAGLTGVGLAAGLFECARGLARPGRANFKLIERGPEILPAVSSWTRESAEKVLNKMGVKIFTNSRFEDFEKEADIFIQATGTVPSRLFKSDFAGHKNIFVIKASTAQSAVHQGKYVADAIIAKEKKKKIKDYKPNRNIYVLELGFMDAFVDLGLIKLKDIPAQWFHQLAFLRHMVGILGWRQAYAWFKKYCRIS
ncbi:FAD-dependent oxidoreductase [Patescibacteria group bacterium]|nr:FAD-dependent oxidoreductase [Patescibacteria group bacterium]